MHKAPEAHAGSALRIQIFLSLGPTKEHNHFYPGFWLRVTSQSPACAPRTTQSPFPGYTVSKKGLAFLLLVLPSLASPQEQGGRLSEASAYQTEPPGLGSGATHSLQNPHHFLVPTVPPGLQSAATEAAGCGDLTEPPACPPWVEEPVFQVYNPV